MASSMSWPPRCASASICAESLSKAAVNSSRRTVDCRLTTSSLGEPLADCGLGAGRETGDWGAGLWFLSGSVSNSASGSAASCALPRPTRTSGSPMLGWDEYGCCGASSTGRSTVRCSGSCAAAGVAVAASACVKAPGTTRSPLSRMVSSGGSGGGRRDGAEGVGGGVVGGSNAPRPEAKTSSASAMSPRSSSLP